MFLFKEKIIFLRIWIKLRIAKWNTFSVVVTHPLWSLSTQLQFGLLPDNSHLFGCKWQSALNWTCSGTIFMISLRQDKINKVVTNFPYCSLFIIEYFKFQLIDAISSPFTPSSRPHSTPSLELQTGVDPLLVNSDKTQVWAFRNTLFF